MRILRFAAAHAEQGKVKTRLKQQPAALGAGWVGSRRACYLTKRLGQVVFTSPNSVSLSTISESSRLRQLQDPDIFGWRVSPHILINAIRLGHLLQE